MHNLNYKTNLDLIQNFVNSFFNVDVTKANECHQTLERRYTKRNIKHLTV